MLFSRKGHPMMPMSDSCIGLKEVRCVRCRETFYVPEEKLYGNGNFMCKTCLNLVNTHHEELKEDKNAQTKKPSNINARSKRDAAC